MAHATLVRRVTQSLSGRQLTVLAGLFCLCACGAASKSTGGTSASTGGTTGGAGNGNTTTYALTVNNQLSWCKITVTAHGTQLAQFTNDSATIQAAANTTINLDAQPLPGFQPAVWTGTTSTTNPTTYVITTDPNQQVTAYCST